MRISLATVVAERMTAEINLPLDQARRDQYPQVLARLAIVGLFVALWSFLWLLRIPMPVPFLGVLVLEATFFVVYLGVMRRLKSRAALRRGLYTIFAAEIVFHTTMVYFLGGITWLGPFAYVFGLIFTNTYLDMRRGFVYTAGAIAALGSLVLLEAAGVVPHYEFLAQGAYRFSDRRFVSTTLIGATGVFFSTYVWINWVSRQARGERDRAVRLQDALMAAQGQLRQVNAALEDRVAQRTADLQSAMSALVDGERLLRATLESTADGILVVNTDGRVLHANRRFAEMWRIPAQVMDTGDDNALLSFVLSQLEDPGEFVSKVQALYGTSEKSLDTIAFIDGRVFERYSRPLVRDADLQGRVWSFRDVSERKAFESRLLELANHDPLTGLYNRRRFSEEIDTQLAIARRNAFEGAVLFLDLDQFKDVNDSRGHRAGDELLVELASLLRGCVREADVVARLGGDEFAIMLSHTHEQDAVAMASRILTAIRARPFVAGGTPIVITASVGVALFPKHADSADEILSSADLAMYQAKENGRNRVCMFEPGLDWQRAVESRVWWQHRIRLALSNDAFLLHGQPIVDVQTGAVTQYELLLRDVRIDGTLVPPGTFLPIAERSGLIRDIDRWVVARAIDVLRRIQRNHTDLRIEVNLSAKAFDDPQLLPLIERRIEESGIDPAGLIFEVTETAAIADLDRARAFIETLKRLGCMFALDDFGVGFSSFAYLKYLPVDYLKIDGSFVRDLMQNEVDQHLVQAIVTVARALGKKTIAEYVPDRETLDLLRRYGVDFAQGFGIGEPAPLPAFLDLDAAA